MADFMGHDFIDAPAEITIAADEVAVKFQKRAPQPIVHRRRVRGHGHRGPLAGGQTVAARLRPIQVSISANEGWQPIAFSRF
jgi:hypothetical protein